MSETRTFWSADEYPPTRVPENIAWIAYAYHAGGYEGDGTFMAEKEDGTFAFGDMCHCSCNDAWDYLAEDLVWVGWEDAKKVLAGEAAGGLRGYGTGFADKDLVHAVEKAAQAGFCPHPKGG